VPAPRYLIIDIHILQNLKNNLKPKTLLIPSILDKGDSTCIKKPGQERGKETMGKASRAGVCTSAGDRRKCPGALSYTTERRPIQAGKLRMPWARSQH
jgi:hypothetical protein